MASSAFYSVKRKGCTIVVRAKDPDAKQVLWGWGSDRGPGAQLYGRGTRRGAGDNEVWEWKLSREGAAEILRGVEAQLTQKKRYSASKRENVAARQLGGKVRRALNTLPKACRR